MQKFNISRLITGFLFAMFLSFCSQLTDKEKDLRGILNTSCNVETLDTAYISYSHLSFDNVRSSYDFLSIVYLQTGCESCYPYFIDWCQKMGSMKIDGSYSVVFIIQGDNYYEFLEKVLELDYVHNPFYTVMDPDYSFLDANENIPKWIIDASILIDSENKIKMVGAPWVNEDMKNLFFKTVSNEQ